MANPFVAAAEVLAAIAAKQAELRLQLADGKHGARYDALCGQIKGLQDAAELIKSEAQKAALLGENYPHHGRQPRRTA